MATVANLTMALDVSPSQLWYQFWYMGHNHVRNWALMGSPIKVLSVIGFYLYFSTRLGPRLMKDRSPMNIRPIIIVYNICMVLLSIYFCGLTIDYAYLRSNYSLFCASNDADTNPYAPLMFKHAWWYLMMKVGELLDTVFFVLRKKDAHVSFLHLLHHSLALWTVWLDLNLGITGQVALFPILNTSVHIVMYSYYGLSALDKSIRPNLWWKRHVTQFQIVQFVMLMIHGAVPIFHDCGFPKLMAALMTCEAGMFAYMFSEFYVRTYLDKPLKVE